MRYYFIVSQSKISIRKLFGCLRLLVAKPTRQKDRPKQICDRALLGFGNKSELEFGLGVKLLQIYFEITLTDRTSLCVVRCYVNEISKKIRVVCSSVRGQEGSVMDPMIKRKWVVPRIQPLEEEEWEKTLEEEQQRGG